MLLYTSRVLFTRPFCFLFLKRICFSKLPCRTIFWRQSVKAQVVCGTPGANLPRLGISPMAWLTKWALGVKHLLFLLYYRPEEVMMVFNESTKNQQLVFTTDQWDMKEKRATFYSARTERFLYSWQNKSRVAVRKRTQWESVGQEESVCIYQRLNKIERKKPWHKIFAAWELQGSWFSQKHFNDNFLTKRFSWKKIFKMKCCGFCFSAENAILSYGFGVDNFFANLSIFFSFF